MSTKHTSGFLKSTYFERKDEAGFALQALNGDVVAWVFTASKNAFGTRVLSSLPSEENAERVMACWNACEGIEDPSVVPELFEALRIAWMGCDHETGGMRYCDKHDRMINALLARAEGRE